MSDNELPKEIPQDVLYLLRVVASSMRATRLYPENNPVHVQAVNRAYEALAQHLQSFPDFSLGIQKTDFSYQQTAAGQGVQLYKGIAGDLFFKGLREITFKRGLTLSELKRFLAILAIPGEELKRKNSIKSLVWENDFAHVEVKEAELGDIVLAEQEAEAAPGESGAGQMTLEEVRQRVSGKAIDLFGRKILLTDVVADPYRFGSIMLELAQKAADSPVLQENRLYDLYRDVGRQVLHTTFGERQPLFDALAESIMGMEPRYRDGLIEGKLYHGQDREAIQQQLDKDPNQIPEDLHELLSARFTKAWNIPQVSTLLERASSAQFEPASAVPERTKLPEQLYALAREMAEYTPEEMDSLRSFARYTESSAVVEALVRTMIYILPQVKNPYAVAADERTRNLFSGVVGHLEDLLQVLLEKKEYDLANLVLRAFRLPVEPMFQQRLADALKRAGDREAITRLLESVRSAPKESTSREEVFLYVSLLDREITPFLLELLADEQERAHRSFLMRILKELGKNQLALLGERLSDERWYFVRNIVTILGENKREEVVIYLERVAGHPHPQIRQEVVRSLSNIRGERAIKLLGRFLDDREEDIRLLAIRGLGTAHGEGKREEQLLIDFLRKRRFRTPPLELRTEAIASLGRIGGPAARDFLRAFTEAKWWRRRRRQAAIVAAAERARDEIERRIGHAE